MLNDWGLDKDWESKVKTYLDLAMEYAKAKAEVMNLENIKHSILARECKSSGEKSNASQLREAYTSAAYASWCSEIHEATIKMESLRLRIKALDTYFEMMRTFAATKRAEMSMR